MESICKQTRRRSGSTARSLTLLVLAFVLGTLIPGTAAADDDEGGITRRWGLGWDQGFTVRRWLGGVWELGVAAGPDDYLVKEESRSWNLNDPPAHQGQVEIPRDQREEHGWVRGQVGRLIKHHESLALVGYAGLVYEWIDYQERALELDNLVGDYDTWELDRFTSRWILQLGLRPSWQPAEFLTIEMAFGLQFVWENWDQKSSQTWAGVPGRDYHETSGNGSHFQDFGWEGLSSLQFIFWL